MQAAVIIPLAHCILKRTYSEGGVSCFLRELRCLPVGLELEYVGQDLSKIVNGQWMFQISEDIACQILMDIRGGMEYLQTNNVVHLDIKAENILFSEGLLDFSDDPFLQ
jgi:serine/threonine protein kinase